MAQDRWDPQSAEQRAVSYSRKAEEAAKRANEAETLEKAQKAAQEARESAEKLEEEAKLAKAGLEKAEKDYNKTKKEDSGTMDDLRYQSTSYQSLEKVQRSAQLIEKAAELAAADATRAEQAVKTREPVKTEIAGVTSNTFSEIRADARGEGSASRPQPGFSEKKDSFSFLVPGADKNNPCKMDFKPLPNGQSANTRGIQVTFTHLNDEAIAKFLFMAERFNLKPNLDKLPPEQAKIKEDFIRIRDRDFPGMHLGATESTLAKQTSASAEKTPEPSIRKSS